MIISRVSGFRRRLETFLRPTDLQPSIIMYSLKFPAMQEPPTQTHGQGDLEPRKNKFLGRIARGISSIGSFRNFGYLDESRESPISECGISRSDFGESSVRYPFLRTGKLIF